MTYRIGLIGNRAHQNTYGPILHARADCSIAAAAEHRADKARALEEQYGIPCARDYDEVLENPQIDIVSIATDFYLKRSLIKKAIGEKKHVLVDKPLARTLREAREIAAAARDAETKIALSYPQRFDAATAKLMRHLMAKDYGRVVSYTHHFVRQFPDTDLMQYVSYPTPARVNGGGELMNLGSHPLDYLYGIYGLPKRVYCHVETAYWNEYYRDFGTEDMATLFCEYEDFTATIVTGRNKVKKEGVAAINNIEVVCEGHHVQIEGERYAINAEAVEVPETAFPGAAGCVQHLIDCIENDSAPTTGVHNGLAVAELTTAAYQSAARAGFVDLPLADETHPLIDADEQIIDGLLD